MRRTSRPISNRRRAGSASCSSGCAAEAARRGSLATCALLIAACASASATRTGTEGDDFHDPALDWSSARSEPDSPVASEPRLVRLPEPAPEPEVLREFTREELERIGRLQVLVRKASVEHGVPSDLINGIIWVESKFQVRARGKRGPRGLMQLMPRTARALARELRVRYRPYDPRFNIHVGTFYFARMVQRFEGNLTLALAAYNIGPGTVRGWLERHEPLPERSDQYVRNVFTAARAFRARGY